VLYVDVFKKGMVGREGLEPSTNGLKVVEGVILFIINQ